MLSSRPSRRHAFVGPPRLWEMKRRFQFEFLTAHGLRPESRLLDIGCGTLRGGIPLIDHLQTGHYTGVEARAEVLVQARRELADAGLEHKRPRLIHAEDPARVQLEAPVDVAWAFSVLFHMRDEIVDACLGLVARSLTEGGVFYANVSLSDRREEQGEWQGFPVISRPREFYADLAARHGLSVGDVGRLDTLGHGSGPGERSMMLRFTRAPAPRSR
jgi:cyclopropane fatty-acyl-phospholipid synthase-like methyltransferase